MGEPHGTHARYRTSGCWFATLSANLSGSAFGDWFGDWFSDWFSDWFGGWFSGCGHLPVGRAGSARRRV